MPTALPMPKRLRGSRYTPVAKRNDRPDAHRLPAAQLPAADRGAGRPSCSAPPRTRSRRCASARHWNSANIKPRDPVILGLCSQTDLNAAIAQANERLEREGRAVPPPPVPETDEVA